MDGLFHGKSYLNGWFGLQTALFNQLKSSLVSGRMCSTCQKLQVPSRFITRGGGNERMLKPSSMPLRYPQHPPSDCLMFNLRCGFLGISTKNNLGWKHQIESPKIAWFTSFFLLKLRVFTKPQLAWGFNSCTAPAVLVISVLHPKRWKVSATSFPGIQGPRWSNVENSPCIDEFPRLSHSN